MHFSGRIKHPWFLAATLTLGLGAASCARAQVHNNPGYDRPGLGFTPAVLQVGDVTLEQGLPDWSRTADTSLYTADTLLRLGVGHALELQLGSGWNRLADADPDASGRADTTLAVKFAPAANGSWSWGLLGSVELTDGARAFRNQRRQYLLGASVNWQHDAEHATGFYVEATHGDTNTQWLAVNESWQTTTKLGVYMELAAQHTAGVGSGSLAGGGLTWMLTPRVQLDISARHRLAGHADTWEGGIGFAVYFGN